MSYRIKFYKLNAQASLDASNLIEGDTKNYAVQVTPGLVRNHGRLRALITGVLVIAAATTITLPANKDVWRAIRPGQGLLLQGVEHGAPAPQFQQGDLVVGWSRTGDSEVLQDTVLASTFQALEPTLPLAATEQEAQTRAEAFMVAQGLDPDEWAYRLEQV